MANSDRAPVAQATNPATGEKGKSYPLTSLDDALRVAERTHEAQKDWRRVSFADARA